jgi:uncharacterized protein (DUF2062 family)
MSRHRFFNRVLAAGDMRAMFRHAHARLRHAFGADEPPARVAAAWALGVGISLSPLLGLHTVIALALAFLFRLNKVDVLLGTLIINPWTLTIYFPAAVTLGALVTGEAVRLLSPRELLSGSAWQGQAHALKPVLKAWFVGATPFALLVALATFLLLRRAIERHRRRHPAPKA